MKRTVKFFALPIAVAFGLAGCTMGPEPDRPTTAADVGESYVHAPENRRPSSPPTVSPWWRTFGDETTIELVELALAHNTDLRVAAARVLEAEAGFEKAGGARLPQIGYGLNASEQRNSFVLPEIGRRDIESTTYSYNFNVSWQADLFGRLKRTQQSQWASLLAEEAAREAVVHAVVAARWSGPGSWWRPRNGRWTSIGRSPGAGRRPPEPSNDATGPGSPGRSSFTWCARTWPRQGRLRRPSRASSSRPGSPSTSSSDGDRAAPKCRRIPFPGCPPSTRFRSGCRRRSSIGGRICGRPRCGSRPPPTASAPPSPTSTRISA